MAVVDLRNAEWYKRQMSPHGPNHDGDFNAYPNDQIEKPEPWKIPNDEYRVITPDEYEEGTILKDRGFVVEDISSQVPAAPTADRYGRQITNRGNVLPFVEYDDGTAGVGMPKWLHEPLEAWKRLQSYQPGTGDEQAVRDAAIVGGAITGGSSAFTRPKGSIGMGGVPEKWTPDIMAQVAKDRKSGMTFRQLGEKYEVDHSRLAKLLKEYEQSSFGKDKFLEEQFQVDRFGRAINQSMQEGYGTALQQRDYMKRLIESGASNEDVSRKMFDRFGVEITPDQVRQRNMWQGTNERYIMDRYGRPSSIVDE